jgi:hypothetical protein
MIAAPRKTHGAAAEGSVIFFWSVEPLRRRGLRPAGRGGHSGADSNVLHLVWAHPTQETKHRSKHGHDQGVARPVRAFGAGLASRGMSTRA